MKITANAGKKWGARLLIVGIAAAVIGGLGACADNYGAYPYRNGYYAQTGYPSGPYYGPYAGRPVGYGPPAYSLYPYNNYPYGYGPNGYGNGISVAVGGGNYNGGYYRGGYYYDRYGRRISNPKKLKKKQLRALRATQGEPVNGPAVYPR